MKYYEVEGKTVSEAIEKGLYETGAKKEDVFIEILNQNEKSAKVRLYLDYSEFKFIEEFLKKIVEFIGDNGKVEFAFHPPRIHSNLITRKSDQLLIGRKGETLNALEHILYQAFKRRFPDFKLRLDISGYKKKRNSYLMHKARALAKFVKETKREITFDYVNEDEERIVRQALRREKGIKVYVVGRGEKRNLVIAPLK